MALSDAALWRSYTSCNTEILGELYERSFKRLLAFNVSLYREWPKAEDNIQNLFFDLIEDKPKFKETEVNNFFRWGSKYCKNRWLADFRKEKRRGEILAELGSFLPYFTDEEKKIVLENLKQIIFQEIQALKHTKHSELLTLAWRGYSNEEIADQMATSKDWVRREKNRALKKIVEILENKGIL